MTDLLDPYASRSRRVVEISCAFPGSAVPDIFANPQSMTLNQKVKAHDVLSLTYLEELKDPQRILKTGCPVRVTWGTTGVGESHTWVGYVHTTRPRRVGTTYGATEVICVSPSMILKQASQGTWPDGPVMSAAFDIISKAGLDAALTEHPLISTLLANGRTHWQVLREIATLTGYSLTFDNTTIIMAPHRTFFDLYAPRARVFSPGQDKDLPTNLTGRTLYDFTPDWSDMSEDEYANHAVLAGWAIDPVTGESHPVSTASPTNQIASNRESPVVNRFHHRVTYTPQEASRQAQDLLADRRWINQATMSGMGSPDIGPYRPVYVEGMGEANDGWWQVLEVAHRITNRTEYTAEMRVGRDGSQIPYQKPSPLPVVPEAELVARAGSIRREPVFRTTDAGSIGISGFGDVGGYWSSQILRG